MASNLPRRTTRNTRIVKDSENLNARHSRFVTRPETSTTQPVTASSHVTGTASTRKLKTVATTEGVVAPKRKREVLVEVTRQVTNNKERLISTTTVKEKEQDKEVKTEIVKVVKPARNVRASTRSTTVVETRRTTRSTGTKIIPLIPEQGPVLEEPKISAKNVGPSASKSKPTSQDVPLYEDGEDSQRVFKRRHLDTFEETVLHFDESQAEVDKVAADLVGTVEPEPKLWDDLDAEDWDDPVMVSEYVIDVCNYWKQVEQETMPDPDYMEKQTDMTWEHRGILIDWILQVHARFGLLAESLFLTVNVLDRFLSLRPISLPKLQLVGVACFFIATKFEETYTPSVSELATLVDNQYTVAEILKAERYILRVLDWDLRAPGPMGWLRRGSKADFCDDQARTVAKYLIEIGLVERTLIGTVPSLLAAAALWLARLSLGREEWTPNLAHYTTFSEKEILPTASIMLEYILSKPIPHESLYRKYAHRRYLKCSAYMRHWASQRWPENCGVELEADLPELKSAIWKERLLASKEGLHGN